MCAISNIPLVCPALVSLQKQAAKEREVLAALRNLHRKREAAAEAMEQLRHAMQLEQQAAQV